jgi:23S rRNA (adenine2503-C2)-methyltransferase
MYIQSLRQRLREVGALPIHEERFLRLWSQSLPHDSGRRKAENFLPLRMRQALPVIWAELNQLLHLQSEHPATDGSSRLLLRLADGQTIEAVRLPKDGLCVSTQVGCAVGCVFCMTGREGLLRQLASCEIVAQVALARAHKPVKKVVFMGMGEPAHNLDNVLEAIDLLGTAGGIGHKNLVFSTVGDVRVFERLPLGRVKPALALSLHTTDDGLRSRLLPRAPKIAVADLVEQGEVYARATGYPIQYQWTLLKGINDTPQEMDGVARLLKGKYAILNMIPYNAVPDLPYQRPDWAVALELAESLRKQGVLTTLRQSAAQEVDGGCGQLRARSIPIRIERATNPPVPQGALRSISGSVSEYGLLTAKP